MVRIDQARAEWITGNDQLAINDAMRYDDHILGRGLLVDIYEQQQKYDLAAAIDGSFPAAEPVTKETYFLHRGIRLSEMPYGPFGDLMNLAILQGRLAKIDDRRLGELADSTLPMFPLLLSVHPAFESVRLMPRAQTLLPKSLIADLKVGEA